MNIIKTFILPEDGIIGTQVLREACRAILLDQNRNIALLHVFKENYYKLPGGGIELGEDKMLALQREIHEETGCDIIVEQELGSVIEEMSTWKQISYCYIGKVGKIGEPHFTEEEKELGFKLVWVSPQEALTLSQDSNPTSASGIRVRHRDLFILQYYLDSL